MWDCGGAGRGIGRVGLLRVRGWVARRGAAMPYSFEGSELDSERFSGVARGGAWVGRSEAEWTQAGVEEST
jgi:hypothetical protein